jgi:ABC-type antimicrobial peptide transport system permease subunit
MRRGLSYFWRSHVAVGIGAAVATAVLTGALLVGDSLRGSLTEIAETRLGTVEHAVIGGGFFRQALSKKLEERSSAPVAPIILLRGSATHAESGARASKLQIVGVNEGFSRLYPAGPPLDFSRPPGQIQPPVFLNESLARELEARVGDEILVTFERPAEVPRELIVGREDSAETIESLRLAVRGLLPDHGAGGFSLTPSQLMPRNIFVDLGRLERALFDRERRGQINLLLVGTGTSVPEIESVLRESTLPEDFGLLLRPAEGYLRVESSQFVLPPEQAEAVEQATLEVGGLAQPVLAYLANSITIEDRSVPYSIIAALPPPETFALGALTLTDGSPAPPLAEDEILLDAWAAERLGAVPGDPVSIDYYVLGPRDELSVESARFRLRGIVRMTGLAVDPTLTPDYPGMHDAEDIASWDPPFPIDLSLIRDEDEEYWDLHRAAPKAFVSPTAGRRLWTTRFGDRTSLRLAPPAAENVSSFAERLSAELPTRLGDAGLTVRPVREDALRRARGATDFAGLFFGLSLFLIASATLLVGLLFRLGVEQRAREVGLRRAVGFAEKRVRRKFLVEGVLISGLGALLGLGGAIGYAWLMLTGLRTWWLPAIGAPVLFLHVEPLSLVVGLVGSVAVVALTIWLALRRLRAVPTPLLLAGVVSPGFARRPAARSRWIAWGALGAALLLMAAALATGSSSDPVYALGVGACLLIAGIASFSWRCGRSQAVARLEPNRWALLAMGLRNSGRNRGRSILSVALIASAVFSIVAVAANRVREEPDVADRRSGAGGFRLLAETQVPIHRDLNLPEVRFDLGLTDEQSQSLAASHVLPFRLLPGEDASCLNLYRPEKPRLLGVPAEMVRRGGFTFQQALEPLENPWELLEREIEPGVIPAIGDYNSALWILHSGLGKDVVIEDEQGREVSLRFVGLLRKSIFQSEILISEANFLRLFPSRTGYSFFLVDAPLEETTRVAHALETGLAPFGLDSVSTARRLAAFQAVENTYISTFESLGGLGLILGTVGLGIVLLRNVLERRGELATLRAFGFRRTKLARMVLAENGYLLLAGLAIGTVAGLAAAAPHLAAAGTRFPWLSLALTLLAVLFAGLLSSILAVRRTLEAPLLPALKTD